MINAPKALGHIAAVNAHYMKQTFSMAGSDLKKRYSSTMFGWAWAIVRPVVFIFVYWFAIEIGIRGNKPVVMPSGQEFQYFQWMIPGVIVWFFLQDNLAQGVSCVRTNSHLVNKMVFPVETIPIFSTIGYCFTHVLMILIALVILLVSGVHLTVYMLQLPYYFLMYFLFCCVVTTFISTLGVISRDFEQLVKAIMNVFFWLTPVLWQLDKLPKSTMFIIKLNPFYYFISGYRDCFLGEAWFFEHWAYTLYSWGFLIVFALITAALHKKLSPEFADVL